MKKFYLLLLLSFLSLATFSQTTTIFSTPGGPYTYTPTGASLLVTVNAAPGGNDASYPGCCYASPGGHGGTVVCTLSVTPGVPYYIYVGGAGATGSMTSPAAGGINGGGAGGTYFGSYGGGGGGGASDIRTTIGSLTSRIVVAGGGGGGGQDYTNGSYGGDGGGTTAQNGQGANSYSYPSSNGNGGGGSTSGGGGGIFPSYGTASSGTLGNGAAALSSYPGGGGGGGYYGGGGGVWDGAGGGSSYTDPVLATGVIHLQGNITSGDGSVVIVQLCNAPGTITGASFVCVGSTTTLNNSTIGSPGTWYSSNPAVATIGSSSGVVTGISPGSVTFTDSVSNPCGASATYTLTVIAVPNAITGSSSVCAGSTSSLSSSTPGGSWSSSSLSLATVGTSTGVVTGVATGNPTISYTVAGCSATQVMTVNPLPAAIGSVSSVCPGGTTTLTDATSGGTWSSANTALATIGSTTGVLTGVSGGSPVISYTLPTGCAVGATVVVNPMTPILGTLGTCSVGATYLLGNATSGGTWTSGNTAVATIGSSSGSITSVSAGTSIITYSIASTGCSTTAIFGVTGSPSLYTVTGGGGYCAGGSGVVIGLSGSDLGVSYQLYTGGAGVGAPVSGVGTAITFAPIGTAATYTVVANPGTTCATNMIGTAVVSVNPLPTVFSVTGGGSYCSGGTGVHVRLSSSTIGVNYQLFVSGIAIGTAVPGTGVSLDFGLQTTAGVYTVVATNATTACVSNMAGSVTVSINPLPTAFSVTGGGGFCSGGTGVSVGLSGSQLGVNYQLYYGGTSVGSPLAGTGLALSFGLRTLGGTYTVVGTSSSTACSATMTSSATVTVNALPTVFTVTGGGAYCIGGTGVHIGLNASTVGVNYQLFKGTTATGAPLAGTGVALDFGLFTASGSYTVVATNGTTGCVMNMSGSAAVSINPLPVVFTVTGGGSYCAGGAGVHVGLSGSEVGITYQLFNGLTLWSAATGTGSAIDFGLEPAAGVYSVTAINGVTGCTTTMTGTATVSINPLPVIFNVTGGGSYCAGGTGVHIGLAGSSSGINYQLFNGTVASGSSVGGGGIAIDFGLRTAGGSYTVVATNATTGCTSIMSGSASITVNPLPPLFTVTGSGGYCSGGTGTHIGLSGSVSGYTYQLNAGGALSGSPLAGTGFLLDFGLRTVPGTYTVVSTNTVSGCFTTMTGSVTVSVNPLPTPYFVTGGGPYCAGGAGVHVNLSSSSAGVKYRLFNGVSPVGAALPGTGSSLDFGLQTATGTYSVVATDTTTLCTNNMTGTTAISINPLPTAYTVTGGGGYCAGGSGVHVGLSASAPGFSYQLFNGSLATGLPVAGTGAALDFGAQTAAGTYTVAAANTTTLCSRTMTGSVTVSINPRPAAFAVTGGGNYCFGTTGVAVGLANSVAGINYQLMLGGSALGAPTPGTGAALSFGLQTAVGVYSAVATNTTSGCTANMTGTQAVNISPLPVFQTVTGGGNYCPGGSGADVSLASSEAGVNYQLYNGTTTMGAPITGAGGPVDFGLQTAAGTYTVRATNPVTTCSVVMPGSVAVGISPLPAVYNVTGTGNYCPSGTGVTVGLSASDAGINYQLYNAFGTVGIPVPGTGLAISFGLQPAGTYTVVATSTTTTCSNTMNGSAVVNVSPVPNNHIVTGGGTYCAGGTGVHVGLNGSDTGIHYRLYLGATAVGSAVAGTGAALDFGLQTAAGTYTITALSSSTTCSSNMTGSAIVNINPLPVAYTATGGGSYCTGGTGVHITLNGSNSGIHYQLYRGTVAVGTPLSGTGALLDFGLQTVAGTYTIVATNVLNGCVNTMAGSVSVVVNALPIAYTVSGGGSFCAGGTGVHVMLSGSNTGVNYQLYVSGTATGSPIAGTGFGLDFGTQTAPGMYTVKATNATTGCISTMTGIATVSVSPVPHIYGVSSTTSNYCVGAAGVDIWLNASDTGINYQLYLATAPVGSPAAGTGGVVDFGYQLGAGMYTIVGSNAMTTCSSLMSSSVTVVIDALPISYNVTGGGGYCAGTSGTHIGLSGSETGVTYQLYANGVPAGVPVSGTGSSLDFGAQSTTGVYSVIGTNTLTTCTNNMSNIVNVTVNPLPVVYMISGGGSYCAGGAGVHIGLGGSQAGFSYQLFNGLVATGSPVTGVSGPLDFGAVTASGTYTVLATNPSTGCASTMLGSEAVTINPLPTAYPVIGGGNYCPGSGGVHVGVNGSHAGVSYQLYNGSTAVGSAMTGSGPAIDFGLQTAAGVYTVTGTDASGCTSTMSGSAAVGLYSLPAVFNVTGGGSYCSGAVGAHVGLNGSQTGVSYQLTNGVVAMGPPVAGTGGIIDFGPQTTGATYTVTARNVTTTCVANMAGSATVTVIPSVTPIVNITSPSGDSLCAGNFTNFTAAPVSGGGPVPVYQWSVNGVAAGVSSTYGYIPLNGDMLTVTMTSNAVCASPSSATRTITLHVETPGTPVVTIAAYPGSEVCQGTVVNFAATPVYGGTAPAYTWVLNSANVAATSNYSYTPANGDDIYCVMNSNYHCRLASQAYSNHFHMVTDVSMTPTVTVTALSGTSISGGQSAAFNATVTGAGTAPVYQWSVNGIPVPGATNQAFSINTLADGDVVSCEVWSSGGCAGIMGSGSVTMRVVNVGVHPLSAAPGDIRLLPNPNKGAFTISGTATGPAANEDMTAEITDMVGQVVYTGVVKAHNGLIDSHIQLANTVANGMYILTLHSADGNKVFHMVVEQ